MDSFSVNLQKCDGVLHINESQWIKLAANKASIVEFKLVLPLFYEHKARECEGKHTFFNYFYVKLK
jgi:hypothetical protein